jgi:hypothetical protein
VKVIQREGTLVATEATAIGCVRGGAGVVVEEAVAAGMR